MSIYQGRERIYTDYEVVTKDNVVDFLTEIMPKHTKNATQSKALFDIYKGKMDIEYKTKITRPEINHKVAENRAFQIVEFWSGTMCGDPIIYVLENKASDEAKTDEFMQFNSYMSLAGKDACNKELFDWAFITGQAYACIFPGADRETPFDIAVIDPWNACVVYNSQFGHKKVAGVVFSNTPDGKKLQTVYTTDAVFIVEDSAKIVSKLDNRSGNIPLIEYRLNSAGLGVFEPVIDLLNAINDFDSDRLDSVTQFVNSLVVIYNATLPEGEDGNSIREKGLITLESTADGVKGDIKILSEQLDQAQNQTLKNDLYNSVLQIVCMPNQSDNSSSDSSNVGAAFLKSGYQLTEMRAKGNEIMFKKCDRELLKIALEYYNDYSNLELKLKDVAITFTRRAYSDLTSKVNALIMMLNNDYIGKLDAWQISGITGDPETCYKNGLANYEKIKGESVDGSKNETATAQD